MEGSIRFNSMSSNEFSLTIRDVIVNTAVPIVVTQTVPYSNEFFDFSAVHGAVRYEQREIVVKFSFYELNKTRANGIKQALHSWLITPAKCKLEVDFIPGYTMARVVGIEDDEFIAGENNTIVTFLAEPFWTIGEYGEDIWDEFNFLNDWTERREFSAAGTSKFEIYNAGMPTVPIITSSSDLTGTLNGMSFKLVPGSNKIPFLFLQNGVNDIVLTGTGTVTIAFNKIKL